MASTELATDEGATTASSTDMASDGGSTTYYYYYLVGFETFPGLIVGDSYMGGTVYRANAELRYAAVKTSDSGFTVKATDDPNVRYVEPDGAWTALEGPNDPLYAEQYALPQIGANEVWEITTGTMDAAICVVDSGVRTTHGDIDGQRLIAGYDFVEGDELPDDDYGHGTHVHGIAGATIGNAIGVAGVANVGMLHAKVLNSRGTGQWSVIAEGVKWCADNAGPRAVVSLSLGGSQPSETVEAAIDYAYKEKGLLVVAAAGNGECDNCILYPARYSTVVAVGCTDLRRATCTFQSSGPEMELVAPGKDILSTCHGADDAYCKLSGTSMSTPHVSAAAALFWGYRSTSTSSGIRTCLQVTARELGEPGRDNAFGYGELDMLRLFQECGSDAGPANDNLTAARAVGPLPFGYAQSTDRATTELAEQLPCGDISSTVWHKWTPLQAGRATATTFGSEYDTVLAVYEMGGALVECNDNVEGSVVSQVSFDALPGVEYVMQVGGALGATGGLRFHLACDECVAPLNDDFAGARTIALTPFSDAQDTQGATTEAAEPLCADMETTVWYRWLAPSTATVDVDTFNSDYNTVLGIYSAPTAATEFSQLSHIACVDDAGGEPQAARQMEVTAGRWYYFQVGGHSGATGNLEFHLQCGSCSHVLTNDRFAAPVVVTETPYAHSTNNKDATRDPFEPQPCGGIDATMWYAITPIADATVTVDTFGSGFDTVLAVYTGPALSSVQVVECNNNAPGTGQSEVVFQATGGLTYYIQAGGFYGKKGSLKVNIDCEGSCLVTSTVANDDVLQAESLALLLTSVTQSTVGATLEPREPMLSSCDGVGATVWYTFAPSVSAVQAVETNGSDFDTVVGIYVDSGGVLVPLGCNNNVSDASNASRSIFRALPGSTYYIQAGGLAGSTGSLTLSLKEVTSDSLVG